GARDALLEGRRSAASASCPPAWPASSARYLGHGALARRQAARWTLERIVSQRRTRRGSPEPPAQQLSHRNAKTKTGEGIPGRSFLLCPVARYCASAFAASGSMMA